MGLILGQGSQDQDEKDGFLVPQWAVGAARIPGDVRRRAYRYRAVLRCSGRDGVETMRDDLEESWLNKALPGLGEDMKNRDIHNRELVFLN